MTLLKSSKSFYNVFIITASISKPKKKKNLGENLHLVKAVSTCSPSAWCNKTETACMVLQAHLVLLYFALLQFTDITFFTN